MDSLATDDEDTTYEWGRRQTIRFSPAGNSLIIIYNTVDLHHYQDPAVSLVRAVKARSTCDKPPPIALGAKDDAEEVVAFPILFKDQQGLRRCARLCSAKG